VPNLVTSLNRTPYSSGMWLDVARTTIIEKTCVLKDNELCAQYMLPILGSIVNILLC
jgi:hypothetical protein